MQSCISADGMQSYDDVMRYIEFAQSLSVDNVAFFEFAKVPSGNVYSQAMIHYTTKNHAPLNPILEAVDTRNDFKLLVQLVGPYYYEEIYRLGGTIDVVFKFADFARMAELDKD